MKLIKFKTYKDYKDIQIKVNIKKLNRAFVTEEEIKLISDNINYPINNILCLGVRNGTEVKYFQKYFPNSKEVIGTDISPTILNFKSPKLNLIQQDFHILNTNWINHFDIVYSNSLDHSYDPNICIKNWLKYLSTSSGTLILVWCANHYVNVRGADCFGADYSEYLHLIKSNNGKIVKELKLNSLNLIFIQCL